MFTGAEGCSATFMFEILIVKGCSSVESWRSVPTSSVLQEEFNGFDLAHIITAVQHLCSESLERPVGSAAPERKASMNTNLARWI